MTIKLIVAVDLGGSIGWADGRLPWHLPPDMARFKALTTGGTVLMGRRTFESLNRPRGLPNRRNIVLTRSEISGVETINSLDVLRGAADLWVIGGAEVYTQALTEQLIDEIYLTVVNTHSGADVTLPGLSDLDEFIANQAVRGIPWELVSAQKETAEQSVETVYLHLKKIPV